MYCRFCGTENVDESTFCKRCGKQISLSNVSPAPKAIIEPTKHQETSKSQVRQGFSCPYCHANGENCHSVVKTDIKTSGGGYGFWNGCCGLILFGPVGLLCGACGSSVKTKVRNETWWVCQKCGKEFMSKHSAIERAIISMRSAAIYSIFASMFAIYSYGDPEINSFWIAAIAVLFLVGLWASIPMAIAESTGQSIDSLLTPNEQSSFFMKFALYCTGSVLLGLAWGLCAL